MKHSPLAEFAYTFGCLIIMACILLLILQIGCMCPKRCKTVVEVPVAVTVPCDLPAPESRPALTFSPCGEEWAFCMDALNAGRLMLYLKRQAAWVAEAHALCTDGDG